MLKSDVPDIVTQAQEIIKSQGLENIDMGQNQLTQTMDPILQDVLQKRPEPEGIMKFADLADQYSNFMFQPRVGKFSISDALGIVSNNPYSMALTGITGAVQGLGALQDRFGIAGVPTVDQFGNLYTGEQLDRMNALGGYYSDPARQSRSRDRRIQSIFDRRVAGKSFSQKVLDDLLEKRAQEEAARQAAATRMQQQNREEGTGGYQSDFSQDSDFMEGSGTAAEMGSF